MPDFVALDKAWNDKVKEVHEKVLKVAQMLADEDAKALMETRHKYLSEELPKLLELQEQAKK